MKKQKTKEYLKALGIFLFGLVDLYAGLTIIFLGKISTGRVNNYHSFDGLERLFGLWPIFLGSLFILFTYAHFKDLINGTEDNDRKDFK
jgi:hypothetical protein